MDKTSRSLSRFPPLFSHPATDRAFKVQKRGAAPNAAHGGWLRKAKNRGQAAETGTSEVPRHAGSGQSPTCHGFAPCREVASLRPGMRGCGRLGAPADAGMRPARGTRCHRSFLGAGCVLCSNNHKSVLAGEARCFQRVEKPWQHLTRSLCVAVQSRCGVSAIPGGRGRELKKIVQPMGTHHTEQRQSSALHRNSSSPGIADERGTEQGKSSCPGGSPYERGTGWDQGTFSWE